MNWIARHRRTVLALICAFWTGFVLLALSFPEFPFLSAVAHGEQSFQDLLRREGRKTATRDDLVFIGIDQQSLQLNAVGAEEVGDNRALQLMIERPYPWSREVWALLLDRLFASGARLVVFDLIFNPPNPGDAAFQSALEKYRDRIVIGSNFQVGETIREYVVPNSVLIPPPQATDDRVGFVNFWPDLDGKVRAIRFNFSESQLANRESFPGENIFHSLSARVLTKLGHSAGLPQDLGAYAIRFSELGAYQPRNLYEIFFEPTWQGNFGAGAIFKDKIVIVGASAQIMHDVVDTPISPSLPGPALHLHVISATLSNEFLRLTPLPARYGLVCGAGLLAWLLIGFKRRPLFSLISITLVTLLYLGAARLLYDRAGLLLLTIPVLVAFVGSGASSLGLDYILERLEKLKTRRTLERYVSKDLVKEILDNPASFLSTMKGARIPVTVLFSDLIGFTTLSERADPEELVRHLNEYLSRMVAVVFEHNGTLDKFIGDAIMAVWGNVQREGPVADAKAAARAALGMRRALKELNAGWRKENRMTLGMGVGINSGEALAGNIGSGDRADLTVIGDAVNLASRLEALTRTYGVDLLVGEPAAELIRDEFHLRSVARVQVKGKTIPVTVSTLLCAKGEEFDQELLKWLESYEEGIGKFRERDFSQAKILFARFLEFYPDDYLAKMYLDRAFEYEKQPPDESWTGAEIFTKK